MFGISPSDLPWWGWILLGFVAAVIGFFRGALADTSKDDSGCGTMILVCLLYLFALLCGGIGLIRFVKWVWG
jgi:hypothetical protein